MIQAPRTKRPEWVDIQQRFESWGDSFTRRAVTTWCWLNPDHINMTDQEIVIGMMTDLWNSMNRSERNEFCGKLIDEAGILEFAKKRSAG